MPTTITNLAVQEAAQFALAEIKPLDYFAGMSTNIGSGKKKGDTVRVQVVDFGASAAYNASSNNYLTSQGSVVNKDVVLSGHQKITLALPPENAGRASIQQTITSGIRTLLRKASADIYANLVVGTFTTTPIVIGAASAMTHKKFVALKENAFTKALDPNSISVLLGGAYTSAIEGDTNVVNAMAYSGQLINNPYRYRINLNGMNLVNTPAVPVGTNIVGAIMDSTALCFAMGSNAPHPGDNITEYSEVVDSDTGMVIGIGKVYDAATRNENWTLEIVYGSGAGLTDKAVLLASA